VIFEKKEKSQNEKGRSNAAFFISVTKACSLRLAAAS